MANDNLLDSGRERPRDRGVGVGSPVWFVIICGLAIALWEIWASTSHFWATWAGAAKLDGTAAAGTVAAGAWGDSFGGFNALVGALGFGAVALTLNLQYRAFEIQKMGQHVSRFEEKFFRLVDHMRSLRENLKYEQTPRFRETRQNYAKSGALFGYDAIESAYYEVNNWIFTDSGGKNPIPKKIVAASYNNYVHYRFESCFAPYFRIIYTILYNIRHDPVLTDQQKAAYGNILRAQFTSFEIGLMAFNATSKYSKDLMDLMVYFRLLKYLRKKRSRVLGKIFPDQVYQARS